jgi:hypothetical protein
VLSWWFFTDVVEEQINEPLQGHRAIDCATALKIRAEFLPLGDRLGLRNILDRALPSHRAARAEHEAVDDCALPASVVVKSLELHRRTSATPSVPLGLPDRALALPTPLRERLRPCPNEACRFG